MQSHKASRWMIVGALAVMLALVLAACGGGAPAAAPAAEAEPVATTSAEEAPAADAGAATADKVPPPAEVAEGAASALTPVERVGMYTEMPPMTIDPSKYYYATIKTDRGDIRVQLFADRAPQTVNSFVFLANEGYYNDTIFHRVIDGFMAQAGDPAGMGTGGPGYEFADEFYPGGVFDRPYLLAMANAGPGTNGSQFFITFAPTDWLNNMHTVFGEVVEGQDVVDSLTRRDPSDPTAPADTIYTILIEEGETSNLPTPTPLPPTPTPFPPTAVEGERPLADLAGDEKAGYFNTAPELVIDPENVYRATISTSQGDMVMELRTDLAPVAVNNFVVLANLGFYDNTPINDVSPGEVVVIGSPSNDPAADVGYAFKPETGLAADLAPGAVAYRALRQDPADGVVEASGSQLLMAIVAPPAEAGVSYSFFGQIVEGLDVLSSLTVTDTIQTITITEE
jgi:cyclophilin family peptidyl-prolyl cis-trans isomerase